MKRIYFLDDDYALDTDDCQAYIFAMKIDEQIKRLTELADVVKRESETLKSLAGMAIDGSEIRLHKSGVTSIANILETVSKELTAMAQNIKKES